MSHIGLVAGTADGAALCYRTLCHEAEHLTGRHAHPEITMHALPLETYLNSIDAEDWVGVAALMSRSASVLAQAGAELIICPNNTLHRAFEFVTSSVPWRVGHGRVRAGPRQRLFARVSPGSSLMRTLIIDDEQYVRLVLEHTLREEGCDVSVASDGKAGIAALQGDTFDCVITDLRMPGIDGLNVLTWVTEHQPGVEVLMLTGHGDVKDAVEAMKQGAWDFLIKDTPFDGAAVKAALAKLRTVRALRQENLAARRGGYTRDVIVEGVSPAWKTLNTQVGKAASSKAPVLIQGETGSGKEVVARLVHELSGRAQGPFLAINCGAMSRELLESELFGHEKGAFTGATGTKTGLVTAANGGTLFLDELAEMPASMLFLPSPARQDVWLNPGSAANTESIRVNCSA